MDASTFEHESWDTYQVTQITSNNSLALEVDPLDEVQIAYDSEFHDKAEDASIKYKIIDDKNVEEPKTGMVFGSSDDIFLYYRQFANQRGFGVVQKGCKKEADGTVKYVTFASVRQGKKKTTSSNIIKPMPTTKTDCKVKINAQLSIDGKWFLTTVVLEHNHDLSPGKVRFFKCNKQMDPVMKRRLEWNDRAVITMSKNFNSLVVEAGRYENLPFVEKDCRNFIQKARHLRLGKGGAEALCEYFSRMQKINDGFFYSIDMDHDCRLKNVFWADARSRASHEYFSDVIMFDTTYMTNRYGMPFAPFVRVNYHGQSILLGAGLISSEDTETFDWLFEEWLKCMNNRAPKSIITDQDRAMKLAIAKVFPCARHRFCLWHIMKKVTSLPPIYILDRWRKDIKRRYSLIKSSYDDLSNNPARQRYENMCKKIFELASMTSTEVEHYLDVMKHIDMLKEKYRALKCTSSQLSQHIPNVLSKCNEVLPKSDGLVGQSSKVISPLVVRGKGRPPSKRKMFTVEKAVKKPRAKSKSGSDKNDKQNRKIVQHDQTSQVSQVQGNFNDSPVTMIAAKRNICFATQDNVDFQGKDMDDQEKGSDMTMITWI